MKFKNRYWERVRVPYEGIGCEWFSGFDRPDRIARLHYGQQGNRTDLDDIHGASIIARDPENITDFFFVRSTDGNGPAFKKASEREDTWYRKRHPDAIRLLPEEEWDVE